MKRLYKAPAVVGVVILLLLATALGLAASARRAQDTKKDNSSQGTNTQGSPESNPSSGTNSQTPSSGNAQQPTNAPQPGQTAGSTPATPANTGQQGETAGADQGAMTSQGPLPTSTRPVMQGAGLPISSASAEVHGLTGHAVAGREHYRRFCIGCHGPLGDGNGENAPYIDPKPRDFTEGTFRCRSTPTGYLPTDEDLFGSIDRGFVTTNMPSWDPITNQDKVDLVAYIKTLSPKWRASDTKSKPIDIPAETPITYESIVRGRDIFQKMECFKCHGPEGRGDGPSANTLTNSKDQPIRPYNFADGDRFKCGSTNRDIYRDFMTGLDGSPMPSFADQLKPNEAWDLVHYLRTLMVRVNSPELRLVKQHPLPKAAAQQGGE